MTWVEFKLALIVALFLVTFLLRWQFGRRPPQWRRRRSWPREHPPQRRLGGPRG